MELLREILALKRPHGGHNECFLAEGILSRLPYELMVFNDAERNPMAYFITTDEDSPTLFTAHLDTVHRIEDTENCVVHDVTDNKLHNMDGTPLGADDGAGVWLLYKMIEAGVPGTYLFPLGEERGGVGAKWVATNAPSFLARFERAIAFDRKGRGSVITHQGWRDRCCSDDFADSLAIKLGAAYPDTPNAPIFFPDDGGVYTDTAEFIDIIPECTNISVGYQSEHTPRESLDVEYLKGLLKACLKVDWSSLPVSRDPTEIETPLGVEAAWELDIGQFGVTTLEDIAHMTDSEIADFVFEEPGAAASLLIQAVSNLREEV